MRTPGGAVTRSVLQQRHECLVTVWREDTTISKTFRPAPVGTPGYPRSIDTATSTHTNADKTKREGKTGNQRPAVPDDQRGPAFPPAVFLAEGNKREHFLAIRLPTQNQRQPPHYLGLVGFPTLHHTDR